MADGDVQSTNPGIRHVALIDASGVGSTTNGVWVDMGEYRLEGVIDLNGIAGGTVVSLYGSNLKTIPANTANTTLIGTFSADAVNSVAICRFMKARISTVGTGTLTVGLIASRHAT